MANRRFVVLLLATVFVAGAASHRLLSTDLTSQRPARELSEDAVERQRILAELEEVHQLRERMLQEGMSTRMCLVHAIPAQHNRA